MKTTPPTPFQSALLTRALCATRYTEQHKALWRAVFQQAATTVKHWKLTWNAEQLVEYWLTITPEHEEVNTIDLDDLATGFKTIAQESGAEVIPLHSLEEFGDNWVSEPQDTRAGRLLAGLEWKRDVHPVTQRSQLPSWCDGTSNPDTEAHLEPAYNGFEGFQLTY